MMGLAKIKILKNKTPLVSDGYLAKSLMEKMKGLLGTHELKSDEALLIPDCKQVHTYFMKYTIDVVFLDSEFKVLKKQTLKPWKISPWILNAKAVLELPEGFADQKSIEVGDSLEVLQNDPA